jgi:hypothetical protein
LSSSGLPTPSAGCSPRRTSSASAGRTRTTPPGGRLKTAASALREAAALGALGWPPQPPPEEARVGGRLHSQGRDAAAIAHHYDVGNEFYRFVLGPTLVYSCAHFERPDATLEEAQTAKLDLVCRKLGLEPGMRFLDVGCGWGSLVVHAAAAYGVSAVGITLSAEQAARARTDRPARAGRPGRDPGRRLDADLEVRDVEALREHYALTLRHWVGNLEREWDRAIALVTPGRARVWRLYMAGSVLSFEAGRIGVNQVLAVRRDRGRSGLPLTRAALLRSPPSTLGAC